MGTTSEMLEPGSPAQMYSRHPLVFLPPNDANFYANAVAASGWDTPDVAHDFTLLLNTAGVASTVHMHMPVNTNYASGDSITMTVTGFDQDYKPLSESVTMSHPTEHARTDGLFVWVSSVDLAATIAFPSAALTIEIGIGDGSATPDIGVQSPWNVPDGVDWSGAPRFHFMNTLGAAIITPDGGCSGRRGVTVDYAAATTFKSCLAIWRGTEFDFKNR